MDIGEDDILTVNFDYKTKDGWSLIDTEHTLASKDVVRKIKPPTKVFYIKNKVLVYF